MTRLTESLLALARNDSITPNANGEVLNIGELAIQVVRSMQPTAQKKEITMTVAETPGTRFPVQVRGDEDQLRQLVYILVDNALKYTPNGGKVCVEYGQSKDNKTILRVTDTGIGIPAEEIPLIFERFYRVDKARSRDLGGTGLGLSIASEIVKMHKASFHVASHLEEGSRFDITFHRLSNRWIIQENLLNYKRISFVIFTDLIILDKRSVSKDEVAVYPWMEVVVLSKLDMPTLNQAELVAAWQKTLPDYLNESDQAKVMQDASNPQLIIIHIDSAGRSFYSFEFNVTYLDSREVKVEFQTALKDNKPIAEQTEQVQELIKDYVRHIHECAQALQKITHS
jgi:two-component sensor histidine kinase